jgi:hypothetical protein
VRGWGDGSGYVVTFKRQEEAAGVSLRTTGIDVQKASAYISTHPESVIVEI